MKETKATTPRERIEYLRQLGLHPITWLCDKKHVHVTRSCGYILKQPTWEDVSFLLRELDRRGSLLKDEEVYDY